MEYALGFTLIDSIYIQYLVSIFIGSFSIKTLGHICLGVSTINSEGFSGAHMPVSMWSQK